MVFPRRAALYMLLVALVVLFLSPFGWLLITALKAPSELRALPIHWWPHQPSLSNFQQALSFWPYLGYARNSLMVSALYALLATLASAWAGFGFARLEAPGKRVIFGVLLISVFWPLTHH